MAVVPIVLLLLSGCVQPPTTSAERAASFRPFAARQVQGKALPDFIGERTALLVGGMPAKEICPAMYESMGSAVKVVHDRYALGSATAIDRRGYLLTAAHCVEWTPLHALYLDNGHVQVVPARVVWRGDTAREGHDLAVLAIDRPLPATFDWADGVPPGDPVIGVGPNYDRAAAFGLGCFSGTALKSEQSPSGADGVTIFHTGPVHLGDSGGPLVTAGGRLIAINVGDIHELNVFRFSYHKASRAHRPDLNWLRDVIEKDATGRAVSGAAN